MVGVRGTQNLVLGSPVRGNRSKENVLASKTPLSSRLSNLCAIYHPGRSEASVVGGISMSTIESHCFYPSGKGVSLKPFHTRCCYDKYINPLVTVHRVKCKGGCYMGGGGDIGGSLPLGASLREVLHSWARLSRSSSRSNVLGLCGDWKRIVLQGLILRKILIALERDYIGPHTVQPRCNNTGCTYECRQTIVFSTTHCFPFLSKAAASQTCISHWAGLIGGGGGPRFASLR